MLSIEGMVLLTNMTTLQKAPTQPTCGIVKRMSKGKTNDAELKYYARVFLILLCATQGKSQAKKK